MIENRDLAPETRLVATYKKNRYFAVIGADGRAVLQADSEGPLPIESTYKSLSAAGSAIMGGIACNGWRFWSLVEAEAPAVADVDALLKDAAKAEKPKKVITRTPNQRGVEAGDTRFYCGECKTSFLSAEGVEPEACPEGHRNAEPVLA